MSSQRPLAWLGRGKEKRALDLFKKHMNKITETTESMEDALHTFCDGKENVDRKTNSVLAKEREADEIKAEIIDELSKGNFPPLGREEIIRLVMTADDIADNARGAAAKITFLDSSELSESLRDDLKTLSSLALEVVQLLESTYLTLLEDPKVALKRTSEVEKMEEEIDHFRASELMPAVIEWSDQSGKSGTSIILKEVADNMEEVADRSEDVADEIRSIAIRTL
ncbi:hypothetical protein AKJ35_01275 [candidate division MSBL1 archaeon SCGC-AAA833F18]|uniref:Phosphate transport regulator n=1 Tax=candidate division MSBL1 archaeon SCGC-AAA833F18 TaxID=1698257 RepID=A0A133VRW0_9EURY|nr:hypothetical protein AKJ35_01275 [candidate division MSBL1 archaeon SCGC-AAA833F18]